MSNPGPAANLRAWIDIGMGWPSCQTGILEKNL